MYIKAKDGTVPTSHINHKQAGYMRLFGTFSSKARDISWPLFIVTIVFAMASLLQLFSSSAGALSTSSSGLVIGSYNVLHCYDKGGSNIKARLKIVASNIQSLGFDVVGLQEYNYPNCRGEVLNNLNSTGGQWQETKQSDRYQMDQASILWNSSVVTLTSQELIDIDKPSNTKPTYISGHDGDVTGGTRYARIAHFTDKTGRAFTVANVHLATFVKSTGKSGETVADHRKEEISNLMKHLESETTPVFITGDMNAATGDSSYAQKAPWKAFYTTVAQYGYAVSHDSALVVQNESLASIGTSTKSANTIDQIFYKNISPPAYYETMDCVSQANGLGSCGSDHHPVKAIFNDLSGSGGSLNCVITANNDTSTTNAYKALNNIHYTGGSVVCCNTATGAAGLVGDTAAEKAYNFLITTPITTNGNQPLSAAQAAGAVGNFMREAGGDTYNLVTDASNGTHFGIVQWGPPRYADLKDFANSKGTEWTDLKTQLEFVVYELENKEAAIVKDSTFKSVDPNIAGARKAAERWDTLYERSGGAGVANRQNNAEQAFKDFTDGYIPATDEEQGDANEGDLYDEGGSSTPSVNTSTSSQSGCTTSVGDTVFPLQASKSDIRQWGNNPGTTEWTSGRYHETKIPGYYAVDIMSVEGTPVVSVSSGKIISLSNSEYFAGALQIQIMSDTGFVYFYQHMSGSRGSPLKMDGTVEPGTVIGYVGNKDEGGGAVVHLHIDKSKPDSQGFRGDCAASIPGVGCPGAKDGRFMKDLFVELHDSYENLPETGTSSL